MTQTEEYSDGLGKLRRDEGRQGPRRGAVEDPPLRNAEEGDHPKGGGGATCLRVDSTRKRQALAAVSSRRPAFGFPFSVRRVR